MFKSNKYVKINSIWRTGPQRYTASRYIQSQGPQRGQTLQTHRHMNPQRWHVSSTAKQHNPNLRNPDPWPVQGHRSAPVATGEFDAKRRLQRDGIATTTTSTPLPQPHDIARRRNAETGSFNPVPSLAPNRIRQNQSLSSSRNGISPGAAVDEIEIGMKSNTVSVCRFIYWSSIECIETADKLLY